MDIDKSPRENYDMLLANGDLFTLVHGMTGDWARDSRLFLAEYNEIVSLMEMDDLDLDLGSELDLDSRDGW